MSMHATCILQIASQGSFHSPAWLRGLFIHKVLMLLTIYFSKKKKKKKALMNKFQVVFFFNLSFLDFSPWPQFSLCLKNLLEGFGISLDFSTSAFDCIITNY